MANTSLQIKSKTAATDKSVTTTVTYINPDADSSTLLQFGQALNNLTTNIYGETNRVQTINVDTEDVPIVKEQGTLTLTRTTFTASDDSTNYYNVRILDTDIESTNKPLTTNNSVATLTFTNTTPVAEKDNYNNQIDFLVNKSILTESRTATLKIFVSETATHTGIAFSQEVTINPPT